MKLHLSNRQCEDLNLYVSTPDTVGKEETTVTELIQNQKV